MLLSIFIQFLDQTHQLRSTPIPCHGFTWFKQLIIQHTKLVPPNALHNFGFLNCDYRSGPIFCRWSQCDVNTLSDSVFEANVHMQRNAVQFLSALIRTEPNFLAPMALKRFDMACRVTFNYCANSACVWHESSASNASHSESLKVFFFHRHAGPRHQNHRF